MGFCAAVGVGHQRFAIPEFYLQGDKCGISICGNYNYCKWKNDRRSNGIIITGNGIRKKNEKNVIVRVRAEAYKRIPMETSGAYQLIDDQTGQKFIVWGGGDDTDHSSSLPSDQQLVSWNPKPQQEGTGIGVTPAAAASAAASLPSFARLKAPKIKALIHNKSSSSKPSTATAIGTKVKQMVIPPPAAAAAAAAHSDSFRERNDERIRKKETKLHQDADGEVAAPEYVHLPLAPRAAASSSSSSLRGLRGWSSAASVRNDYYDATAIVQRKQLRGGGKMPADSGFFSRKSFKDLRCSDDLIEALRSLAFTRSSHIQAVAYAPVLGKVALLLIKVDLVKHWHTLFQ